MEPVLGEFIGGARGTYLIVGAAIVFLYAVWNAFRTVMSPSSFSSSDEDDEDEDDEDQEDEDDEEEVASVPLMGGGSVNVKMKRKEPEDDIDKECASLGIIQDNKTNPDWLYQHHYAKNFVKSRDGNWGCMHTNLYEGMVNCIDLFAFMENKGWVFIQMNDEGEMNAEFLFKKKQEQRHDPFANQ